MYTSNYEMEILARLRHGELVKNGERDGYRRARKNERRHRQRIAALASIEPKILRTAGLHNSVLF